MNIIDSAIGVISPKWAVERQLYREKLKHLRQYAAAKTTRSTGTWVKASESVNDEIENSYKEIIARVRQLSNDFPVFFNALNSIVDFTVGSGMKFQMKLRHDSRELDENKNNLIEDLWEEFKEAKNCDYGQRLSLEDIARLCQRTKYESGDFILVYRYEDDPNRMLPFSLQVLDPNDLTSYGAKGDGNTIIKMGIEYDRNTLQTKNYYFADDDDYSQKHVKISAKNILHGFDALRPGQIKGISPLASAVLMADSIGEYIGSELDGAKLMSRYVGFVTTPNAYDFQRYRSEYDSDDGIRTEEIDSGILEYLKPGEEIKFNDKTKNSSTFEPFMNKVLRMISITTGLPYEVVTGDYHGLNYTVSRVSRNDMAVRLKPVKDAFINSFYMPIFKKFLEAAYLKNKLPYSTYMTNPRKFVRAATFTAPGLPKIDPMRETRGQVEGLDNMLITNSEIARNEGKSFEDVVQEAADDKKLMQKFGLERLPVSESLQTNPAKVEEED